MSLTSTQLTRLVYDRLWDITDIKEEDLRLAVRATLDELAKSGLVQLEYVDEEEEVYA